MAGYRRSLQADGHRRRLESDPSVSDDGGADDSLRQAGQAPLGQHALSDTGLRGDAALAVLLKCAHRFEREPGRQREHDLQGLFHAPCDSNKFRHRQLR